MNRQSGMKAGSVVQDQIVTHECTFNPAEFYIGFFLGILAFSIIAHIVVEIQERERKN